MGKKIDLTGQRFGKWLVISKGESPSGYEHQQFWLCRCDCGTELVRKGGQLRYAEKKGVAQSCQRCGAIRHGYTKSPEHRAWINMHDRCRRPENHAYARYGGRGISVCDRWKSFENFIADMGHRPTAAHSLDRIDNNGNYCPENCRWTTQITQNRNNSGNKVIEHNGESMSISEWAEKTGIPRGAIYMRLRAKWSIGDALTTQIGDRTRWHKCNRCHS